MVLQAFDSEVCASVVDTAVAVVDEGSLEEGVCVVVEKVVDDAVAEMCGKHFAHLGLVYHETGGWKWPVCGVDELVAEGCEVVLEVEFKL